MYIRPFVRPVPSIFSTELKPRRWTKKASGENFRSERRRSTLERKYENRSVFVFSLKVGRFTSNHEQNDQRPHSTHIVDPMALCTLHVVCFNPSNNSTSSRRREDVRRRRQLRRRQDVLTTSAHLYYLILFISGQSPVFLNFVAYLCP